eukprot:g49217.t1
MLPALLLFATFTAGFYLPGVAPRDYADGEPLDMKVVKLDSKKNQLPFDYYSLPFCRPERGIEKAAENLGEILSGESIQTSAYEFDMNVPEYCKLLCAKEYSARQLNAFATRIEEDYRVNWLLDNMPAATKFYTESHHNGTSTLVTHYEKGFPLGSMGRDGVAYINNHVRLTVFFHQDPSSFEGSRVVGFEVQPYSVLHQPVGKWQIGDAGTPTLLTCPTERLNAEIEDLSKQPVSGPEVVAHAVGKTTIFWTYDVLWEESDVKWASRWDLYLKMTDSEIHWFSIVNSITIVLCLTGIVALILVRTLKQDILRYNTGKGGLFGDREESARDRVDQIQEDSGWKTVCADVFRPPVHGAWLAVLLGTGSQVLSMVFVTLTFALCGFLSPANRGGLLSALLLLFVLMGYVAGWVSTRIYKSFGLMNWKKNAFRTATVVPGTIFAIFFVLNLIIWGEKSSGAVPFPTLVALVVLWLGISGPLVYVGSVSAFKKPVESPPVPISEHLRQVLPASFWLYDPLLAAVVAGALPFGGAFIEIFFIMSSVWLHQFYYVFGVLYIVFFILLRTCAEISIVLCYFNLCNEDYHWWWRSVITAGSSALWLFLYSVFYFFTRLEITGIVSAILFFGYMLIVSILFFLFTGTVGYFACYYFLRKIYGSLKID